jgi:predicted ATPase
MFIKHFGVKNFMIHRDTELELFPVTVLVGYNNAGKSALFDALINFSMVSRGRLSEAFGSGPYSFTSRKSKAAGPTARIKYTAVLAKQVGDKERLHYTIVYSQRKSGKDYVIHEETLKEIPSGKVLFSRSEDVCFLPSALPHLGEDVSFFAAVRRVMYATNSPIGHSLVEHCAREMSLLSKYRLDPAILARPSSLPDPAEARVPWLSYEGDGLASVLYYLAETASPKLAGITQRVAEVIEGFEGFEFSVVGTDRVGFLARFADSRGSVFAANPSAGTLALIGITVLLASENRSRVLCLEEPENGLTPRSTRAVYEAVLQASAPGGETQTQILLSSHSPFVLCEAWNGEGRDFIYQIRPEEGQALIRPVADIIEEQGIQLRRRGGERVELGLTTASEIMHGYYS